MESRLGTVRGHEAVIASLTDAHACIGGGQRQGPEASWRREGGRGSGRGAQGPGGRELGVTGSVLQEDHQLCLSELTPKAWKGRAGVCLPPPRSPAPRVGERTLLALAAPRRAPAGPIPAPSLSLLVPERPAGRGHGPTPGPPGTDIGVPGAVLPDHRQVPELGDGEGRGQRGGKGTVGRTDKAVRSPEKALASHPQPALPTGTTRGAHAARRHRVPGQRPAVPAPSLLAPRCHHSGPLTLPQRPRRRAPVAAP